MTQYGTIITNIGLAQIANAQVTQQKVGLQYIALGDGNGSYYAPNANQTTLVNEVWRGPVSNVTIDPANDNRIIIEGLIPPTAGGFTIREIAVFDDQNQLIAVGQYPEKYKPQLSEGVSEETLIHFVIETNNVDAVELAIDPTIIIASRQYVDEKVAEHKEQITAAVQDLEDLVESIVQTGVAKLVRYSYTIPATTDGQTEIEIPLTTFDQDTDTVLLIRDSIVLYETVDYTISTRKIVLNTPIGIAANTSFYLLILKNVPSGEEGGVSGGVITDGSIAKRKLEQTLQDEIGNAWQKGVYNDTDIINLSDKNAKRIFLIKDTDWQADVNNVEQASIVMPAINFAGSIKISAVSTWQLGNASGAFEAIYYYSKVGNNVISYSNPTIITADSKFTAYFQMGEFNFNEHVIAFPIKRAKGTRNHIVISVELQEVGWSNAFNCLKDAYIVHEDLGNWVGHPWIPQTPSFAEKGAENTFTKRTSFVLPNDSSHLILERTGTSSARGSIGISSAGIDFRDSTTATRFIFSLQEDYLQISNTKICVGSGSPEGTVSAVVGSLYLNRSGSAGTSLYVKQSGTGNVGWVAK